MNRPVLYSIKSHSEALRGFPGAAALLVDVAGEVGWWMSDDALICFADVGRSSESGSSFFPSARRFEWVAPLERRGEMAVDHPGVPIEVRAHQTGGRSLFVFVRGRRDDPFTFIGQTNPAYSWGCRAERQLASFELIDTVPSAVLARLGVLEEPVESSALDARLQALSSLTVDERLSSLQGLLEYWHGPLGPADGVPSGELEGRSLPKPIRWWLEHAGRRADLFAQNYVLGLDEPFALDTEDGKLVFFVENQGVWEVATLPDGDDPPVWGRMSEPEASWEPQDMPLSIALLYACLFEVVLTAPYGATAPCVGPEFLEWLAAHVPALPVRGFTLTGLPTRFHVGNGVFAAVSAYDGHEQFDVYIGAKTEAVLAFLEEQDQGLWEACAF